MFTEREKGYLTYLLRKEVYGDTFEKLKDEEDEAYETIDATDAVNLIESIREKLNN